MKDNFAQEEEGVGQFFEKQRQEFSRDKRVVKIKKWIAFALGVAGFGVAAFENWRLSLGAFLVWWSVNIIRSIK